MTSCDDDNIDEEDLVSGEVNGVDEWSERLREKAEVRDRTEEEVKDL